LGVWGLNARARAFYERQHFSVIGTRPFRIGTTPYTDPVYAREI